MSPASTSPRFTPARCPDCGGEVARLVERPDGPAGVRLSAGGADRIRELRREGGLTHAQIATRMGCSKFQVSHVLRGWVPDGDEPVLVEEPLLALIVNCDELQPHDAGQARLVRPIHRPRCPGRSHMPGDRP